MDKLFEVAAPDIPSLPLSEVKPLLPDGASDGCPIAIALVDEYSLSRFCLVQALRQSLDPEVDVRPFATIEEALVRTDLCPKLLILCSHRDTERRVKAALEAIGETTRLFVVTDERISDVRSFFKETMRSGVCGFVSTSDTEFRTMTAAVSFVLNGGIFLPPELLVLDSTDSDELKNRQRASGQLTPRQSEVFAKLREGKPNKLIAYELGMSEATVKVHVRNIMGTVGATNRTQAVWKGHHATGI